MILLGIKAKGGKMRHHGALALLRPMGRGGSMVWELNQTWISVKRRNYVDWKRVCPPHPPPPVLEADVLDRLSILPLSTLQGIQDQLVTISAQASATLAWSLQLKDAQNHDSAT
jgi:hypothetical protein